MFLLAPVVGDLDMCFKKYLLPKECLHILARFHADLFQRAAPFTDDDPLLRIAFNKDLRIYTEDVLFVLE